MKYRSGEHFTVLALCTGNVCRSPAIERLLRASLASDEEVAVMSAGVGALVGEPIQPPMARLLEERGVDAGGFAARQVTKPMAASADLILTATRRHRATIVDLDPAAVRRTFTLREFARLAGAVDPGRLAQAAENPTAPARLAALVPLAAAGRQEVPADLDDIIDPFQRSEAVYHEAFEHITGAVGALEQIVLPGSR